MSLLPSEDSAWLDAQYNPRAAVPDHAQLFERWRLDSARAREQADCLLDLAYGDTSAETLDVFRAAAPGAPILVFIHGGWWRAFDKSDHSFVAPAFVRTAFTSVIAPATSFARNFASASMRRISRPLARRTGDADVLIFASG